ncbi:MAG: ribokinase [Christensenellaceae bacterium]|nr:ribokinase [Christensenellaceae bacterium]
MNRICVLGSITVDMTVTVERFHAPGESMIAEKFETFTGGKGGNQAVACARLGAAVMMIGCVGEDSNGRMYLDALEREGVDTAGVVRTPDAPTGVALIEVDKHGENRILVAPGANFALTCDMVSAKADALKRDVCLFQMENPLPAITHGMALAKQAGALVVLDPAPVPAAPVSDAVFALCDYVTPNETELHLLTGMPVDTVEQAAEAAAQLIRKGAKAVINKRGGQGALLVTAAGYHLFPGFKVNVVDTTAAGDSFNAGLSVGLAKGYATSDAVVLANAVGALSTTARGAQAAMPTFEQAAGLIAGTD